MSNHNKKVIVPPTEKIGANKPADPLAKGREVPPAAKAFQPKQYKVLKPSFINGQLVGNGDVVQLPEGVKAGANLEPIGKQAGAPVPVKKAEDAEPKQGPQLTEEELKTGKREPSEDAKAAAAAGHTSAEADPI